MRAIEARWLRRPLTLLGVSLVLLATATAVAPAAAARPTRPAGGDAALTFTEILGGYIRPVLVTHDGSSRRRLFIVEQTGRIRVARLVDGAWRKAGVFLDLSTRVNDPRVDGSEQGLLGLAFDPEYATNGRFYVNYTRRASGDKDGDTVVAEYRRLTATRADPNSRRVVMVIDQPYANHNGGHLAFGPDGYLYVATGDGGSGGDPDGNGQDLSSPLGKLLRIDPTDPDRAGPKRYSPAPGNPFIGETEKDSDIWAYGLRNPWRLSFDRETGDLYTGDVGQNEREEIDRSRATDGVDAGKGANFGWNACEGDLTYPGGDPCDHAGSGFVAPLFDYRHGAGGPADGGCAVTGGYVIRAPRAGAWQGLYLFGDFCTGQVSVLAQDGSRLLTQASGSMISSFGEDAAGRLYLVDLGGRISRIGYPGDPTP